MDLPIFFIDNYPGGDFITLNEETSKHVVQVLRMKQGEELQLTNGKGSLLTTAIVDDHKKKCTVSIKQKEFREKAGKEVCVGISLLKNANRLQWFLEKATEIGVTEIIPLLCERTEKQHFRYDRMNNILIAAMLQSQQVWLPLLHHPMSFKEINTNNQYATKLIAHCEEEQKEMIHTYASSNSTQILIGPEGDFTTEEINAALSIGYKPVTLGNTRLRTETAGVVAATLLCIP
jgi:16S rRNA (uracil1498-N3)-methyltransferase